MRRNPFEPVGRVPSGYTTDVAPFVKGGLLEQTVATAPDAGIYHVTSNLPRVLQTGRLLSRYQLRMMGVEAGGLGGGAEDEDANTVSTGVTFSGALRIARGMRVMSNALRGRLGSREALMAMEEVNAPSLDLIERLLDEARANEDVGVGAPLPERLEERMAVAAEEVMGARRGPDLYEALCFWEGSLFYAIATLERAEYLEPEDYFCRAPVGFLEPPAVFAAVKPENVGILQMAARKGAESREVVSECELRFNPADLIIAAVWK
jgi:hypothetical protein